MKLLISKSMLDSMKCRDPIPLECYNCHNTHYKPKNLILRILNGNLQNTKKGCFCSKKCFGNYNTTKIKVNCKECNNELLKYLSELKNKNTFCNSSCSAKYNNKHRIIHKKRNKKIQCKYCKNDCITKNKSQIFCSLHCSSNYKRDKVANEIKNGNVNGHCINTLKRYLLNTRGCKCEICEITEWRGIPLVCIMDHIDGNSSNNSLDNLRLLCSNCDANLPTYKSKNKGHGRYSRRIRYAAKQSY